MFYEPLQLTWQTWTYCCSHYSCCCCCWVASVVSDSVRPHRRQPTRLPHPWDSPGKNTGVSCHFQNWSWVSFNCLTFGWYNLLGASVRNSAHGKGHEEGSLTKCKGIIWLQGFSLNFPEHLPPKPTSVCFIVLCFPLFWHNRGPSPITFL